MFQLLVFVQLTWITKIKMHLIYHHRWLMKTRKHLAFTYLLCYCSKMDKNKRVFSNFLHCIPIPILPYYSVLGKHLLCPNTQYVWQHFMLGWCHHHFKIIVVAVSGSYFGSCGGRVGDVVLLVYIFSLNFFFFTFSSLLVFFVFFLLIFW